MPLRLDADRWGDLEIVEVAPIDLPSTEISEDASWWCGRCGDDHHLTAGAVVKLRSHLGVTQQIACPRCAGIARRRLEGARPRRVLLVEDDPDHRDLTRRFLEQTVAAEVVGYVSDGEEALTEITRLGPDVVILDLAMPRLDGVDLLERLPNDIEAIVLSGVPGLRDRCQALHDDVTVIHKGAGALDRLVDVLAGNDEPPGRH
jgi:CheY-like chemotaxis protein